MTVASTLARKTFAGDAVTTSFGTSPMVFFDTSDLEVRVTVNSTGVSTLLVENTGYTVSGGGTQIPAVGTVSLAGGSSPHGAVAAGSTLVITRVVALTQQTDFVQDDPSDADVAEATIDKLTMIAQQHEDALGRSFTLPDGDVSGASTALPTPTASTILGWNSTASALQNYVAGDISPTIPVSTYMQTVLDDVDALTARTTLGFPSATDGFLPSSFTIINGYLDWSVAASALTVAVKTFAGNTPSASDPVYILVRSTTAATGSLALRKLTAATSVTINNTALVGTVNSIAFRLWCVAFDDAGTVRLGIINCLTTSANSGSGRNADTIYPLGGWGIASSTLSDNAADNAQVFYTGAAVASKAYSTLGYATWETGLATAGVWSAAPTHIQLFGPGVPLPGQRLQSIRTQPGATIASATVLPFDNTIPQNTEGTQAYSLAITTASATNVLEISSSVYATENTGGGQHVAGALFVDAVANAVVAASGFPSTDGTPLDIPLRVNLLAQAIAAVKMRFGNPSGASTYLNGLSGGGGVFGGVAGAYLQVDELMA